MSPPLKPIRHFNSPWWKYLHIKSLGKSDKSSYVKSESPKSRARLAVSSFYAKLTGLRRQRVASIWSSNSDRKTGRGFHFMFRYLFVTFIRVSAGSSWTLGQTETVLAAANTPQKPITVLFITVTLHSDPEWTEITHLCSLLSWRRFHLLLFCN